MGNSLAFPSILVETVTGIHEENEGDFQAITEALTPNEPLIGDTLQFEDFKNVDAIEYNLQVIAARPELAKVKARFYVRAKNPFEPDIIKVFDPEKIDDINLMMNKYKVDVRVEK